MADQMKIQLTGELQLMFRVGTFQMRFSLSKCKLMQAEVSKSYLSLNIRITLDNWGLLCLRVSLKASKT